MVMSLFFNYSVLAGKEALSGTSTLVAHVWTRLPLPLKARAEEQRDLFSFTLVLHLGSDRNLSQWGQKHVGK